MKAPWTVYLEFGPVVPSSSLRIRRESYEKQGAEVIQQVDGTLVLRTECLAYSFSDALQVATKLIEDDVARGILPPPEGISCYRSGGREPVPELVGLSEVAGILGVTRQRVAQLAKQPEFPLPVAKLAMGPVFSTRSVRRFEKGWQRRVGRPRLPSYAKNMAERTSAEWRKAAGTGTRDNAAASSVDPS
jgi:hypothetical protein